MAARWPADSSVGRHRETPAPAGLGGDPGLGVSLISQDILEGLGLHFTTETRAAEVMLCAYEQSGLFLGRAGVDYG